MIKHPGLHVTSAGTSKNASAKPGHKLRNAEKQKTVEGFREKKKRLLPQGYFNTGIAPLFRSLSKPGNYSYKYSGNYNFKILYFKGKSHFGLSRTPNPVSIKLFRK